jgi:hypothetical protein
MATLPTTELPTHLPPDNQPGHHPDVEQDKPTHPPRVGGGTERFPFAIHPMFRLPAAAFGVTADSAFVEVDLEELRVHFGRWRMTVPRTDIAEVTLTGPYRPWRVIGPPHLSFRDRGITFATTPVRGVCVRLREPRPGIDPLGLVRHPGLTVTVADPEALAALLTDGSQA